MKLTHRTGHACVLNSLALRLLGISAETPEPEGGLIDRDLDSGEPSGLLFEMNDYIDRLVPPLLGRGAGRWSEAGQQGIPLSRRSPRFRMPPGATA